MGVSWEVGVSRKRVRGFGEFVPYVGRNWVIGGSEPEGFENAKEELRRWRIEEGSPESRPGQPAPRTHDVRGETVAGSPGEVYQFVRRLADEVDTASGLVIESGGTVAFRHATKKLYYTFTVESHLRGLMIRYGGASNTHPPGRAVDHRGMTEHLRHVASNR